MTENLVTIKNDKGVSFRGLVIGNVTEGETTYTVAVTEHGGIWYKGDWVKDKWQFLSEKAFTERFPFLAKNTLNNPNKCKICEEYHCLAGCVPIEKCRIKALEKKHDKQGWLSWADHLELCKLDGRL